MVTKTVIRDLRSPFSGDCGLDTNHGLYYRKYQSGADYSGPRPTRKRGQPRRRFVIVEPHPYTMEMSSFRNFPIRYKTPFTGPNFKTGTALSCFGGIETPNVLLTANDELQLINSLYEQVAGSDFNLAVTLVETRETLDTIANGAIKIARALQFARKLDVVGVAKALGVKPRGKYNNRNHGYTATSLWLEHRYGWMPILQDTYSAAKLLAVQLNMPQSKRYTSRIKRQASLSAPAHGYWKYGTNVRVIRKQIVAYISEQPSTLELTGLLNPLAVAWEAVPFSFVADWFLPVGNYLQARGAASVLKGTFVTTTFETTTQEGLFSGNFYTIENGQNYGSVSATVTRTVSNSLNVPLPSFVPFSKAISWKRAVSALSLLNNFDLKFKG